MGPNISESKLTLGGEFTKRLDQLNISRREFVRRSGISRQTLHKIEHEGHVDLWEQTYSQLDEALYWVPGTAKGLARGTLETIEQADALTQVDRESAYRWRIVERITSMSLEELERLVAMMESEKLGTRPDFMLSSDDVISIVEAKLAERLGSRAEDEET